MSVWLLLVLSSSFLPSLPLSLPLSHPPTVFTFAHDVGSEPTSLPAGVRSFFHHEILGPRGKVLEVEPQVVGFRQDVEVDIVETEEVFAGEATQGALWVGLGRGGVGRFVCVRRRE